MRKAPKSQILVHWFVKMYMHEDGFGTCACTQLYLNKVSKDLFSKIKMRDTMHEQLITF